MSDTVNFHEPFDEETQELLFLADNIATELADRMREHFQTAELRQEDPEMSEDDYMLLQLVKAYGVLYNNAIKLGQVRGSILIETEE